MASTANPIDVTSHYAEPYHDDETGDYMGTGLRCEHCGERIDEGQPVVHLAGSFVLDVTCADSIADAIKTEVAKYG